MNVFPHATAYGRNHSGIIAGKLNGVIAATTPTGWRTRCDVDAARDLLEVLALEQVRGADRGLDRLDPAADLAERVVERLAHVARDEPGELVAVGVERVAHGHERAGADERRRRAPCGLGGAGGPDRGVDVGGASRAARARAPRRWRGRG